MEKFVDLVERFESDTISPIEVRRWGVEIESPHVAKIGHNLDSWDLHNDESVEDPDCECQCDECYHSCDCGNCQITNGWQEVDHCGDCMSNEASSPVLWHNRFDTETRETLAHIEVIVNQTMAENEGGHIHIEARDLNLSQIGQVQKGYLKLVDLLGWKFIGREFCHFAKNFSEWDESDRLSERYCAVNATNLVRYGSFGFKTWADDPDRQELRSLNPKGEKTDYYKTTLEFRQFATTSDPELIEARASILRALVDYFANGGAWYWFAKCQTAEALFDLLQPQHH